MSKLQAWRRREFLKTGASAGAAVTAMGVTPIFAADAPPRLRTSLCDLLRIEYPILQSGMSTIAGPELAAAVSRAGGLGIVGCAHVAPEDVRKRIRAVKQMTDRPFGVNLLLHTDIAPPADVSRVPESVVRAVHTVLNRFRERLGLPASFARPVGRPDHVPGSIEIILEEKVPVFSIGLGKPSPDLVARFHKNGSRVIAMVASLDDARAVVESEVDAVVVQGSEAGGHRSTWVKAPSPQHAAVGTIALVPEIVAALKTPVIAAGGITSGAGVVAALALGAKGALLGTRFVATRESATEDFYKQELIRRNGDSTTVTDAFTGLYARVLRNTYTTEYGDSGAPVLPGFVQNAAAGDILRAARDRKDREYYPMWAGQGVGLIRDLPAAGDVVRALVDEARAVMLSLESAVSVRTPPAP